MTNFQSLEFFVPELILVITILDALITDLFLKKSKTALIQTQTALKQSKMT